MRKVGLGGEFPLAMGESVLVGPELLQVSFAAVVNDSRCPADGQCVSAGDAVVRVSVRHSVHGGFAHELHTNPGNAGAGEVFFAGYSVRLAGLAPAPRALSPLSPQDYVARFVVTRF